MAKKTYVVMGATGQIGRVVCEELLNQGHTVKAIGRDPRKLEYLKNMGAEAVQVESFDRKEFIIQAFEGADGAFCLIPPGHNVEKFGVYQNNVGEAVKEAIAKNSIGYVVNLSSIGAHLPDGTGPIKGLHQQEERLNTLTNVNVLHLRPAYFMENFFWSIPVILQTGMLKTPLKPDLSLPLVATPDIGMKAAEFLNQLDFQGHTIFELAGPRDITLTEATKILGTAIGKPDLKYAQFPYEETKKGMLASGMRGEMVDLLIEMYHAFNEGKCQFTQKLTPDHRGKIAFEQFARAFGEVYKVENRPRVTIS